MDTEVVYWLDLADLYEVSGEIDEALEAYKRVAKLADPGSSEMNEVNKKIDSIIEAQLEIVKQESDGFGYDDGRFEEELEFDDEVFQDIEALALLL